MPSGNIDHPMIEDNRDGTVSVKYEPKEEGLHELVVKYNSENVQETARTPVHTAATKVKNKLTNSSEDSVMSSGFVPTVKPPGRIQSSNRIIFHGRWRETRKDPYFSHDPLASVLENDINAKSVKTGIKHYLLRREPKKPVPVLRPDSEKIRRLHEGREKAQIKFRSERFGECKPPEVVGRVVGSFRSDPPKVEELPEELIELTDGSQSLIGPNSWAHPLRKTPPKWVICEEEDSLLKLEDGESPHTTESEDPLITEETIVLESPDPFTFGQDSGVIRVTKRPALGLKQEKSKYRHASPRECMLRSAPPGAVLVKPASCTKPAKPSIREATIPVVHTIICPVRPANQPEPIPTRHSDVRPVQPVNQEAIKEFTPIRPSAIRPVQPTNQEPVKELAPIKPSAIHPVQPTNQETIKEPTPIRPSAIRPLQPTNQLAIKEQVDEIHNSLTKNPERSIDGKVADVHVRFTGLIKAFRKKEAEVSLPKDEEKSHQTAVHIEENDHCKSKRRKSSPKRERESSSLSTISNSADDRSGSNNDAEVGGGDKVASDVCSEMTSGLGIMATSAFEASTPFVILNNAISSHLLSASETNWDSEKIKPSEPECNLLGDTEMGMMTLKGSSTSRIIQVPCRKSSKVLIPVSQRIHLEAPPSQSNNLYVPGSHSGLLPTRESCLPVSVLLAPSPPERVTSHTSFIHLPMRVSTGVSMCIADGAGDTSSSLAARRAGSHGLGSTFSTGFSLGYNSHSDVQHALPTPGPHHLRRVSTTHPHSQSSVSADRPGDTRRCFSGNDLDTDRVIVLDHPRSQDSVHSENEEDCTLPRKFGLDAILSTRLVRSQSRLSAGIEKGDFLSISTSYASLGSVEVFSPQGADERQSKPLLGIPLSGTRDSKLSSDSARDKRRDHSKQPQNIRPDDDKKNKEPHRVKSIGLFKSATSVPTLATACGGEEKLRSDTSGTAAANGNWGRWRNSVRDGQQQRKNQRRSSPEQKRNPQGKPGSPFKFHVDSISSGYVTAYGPGLVHGITGEPADFTISTKDAGAGGLSLAVEGPSKAEISCHDNKDGTVSVSYLPTAPGEYKVSVKFADKHIKGSPYSVKVTGEGRKRNQVSLGSQSEVALPGKVTERDIKALNASITAPSGLEEPCFIKKLPNDHLGISFTPRETGPHLVTVKKKGVEIQGSPFKIMVSPKEVGDASKVKVSGAGLTEGRTHQDNKILIDTKEAGYGGLSMSIEGPSKAEIKCDDKDDGKLEVSYNPKEPGFYIINLKFADHHVHGSPFTAKVSGEGTNNQTERIKRDRDAVPITSVGSSCALTFKMPGVSAMDLSATVTSPGGLVEDASLSELEEDLHAVNFVPKELGVHTVSVRYRDVHIPGSPFQFTVGPLKDGGAHRVHAGGPGLERGEQDRPNEFNVWTREAGAGSLAISVEGPSKAEIDFKDRKDGSCYVSYVVSEPGEYRVGVKFNDSHIPDSPYKVFVTPSNKDARRINVNQLPDTGVQVDKPIVFLVDRTGCRGQLDVKAVSPSGEEDDCAFEYLDEDTYSVRFVPRENGIHQVHVKWDNVHVPGSPFRIKVGKQEADPAAVHAHGKGLESGHTGQKSDFIIDTCNAGAGTLAVTVDGPSKVSMDCTEVDEGYKVRYTPLSPGDYYCGVKYAGYHIAGSPFKVPVEGDELAERGPKEQSAVVVETVEKQSVRKEEKHAPSLPKFNSDATKVSSKGMGLKRAFVGRQNQFTVDAGHAGQDMLWVGCFGPKNPCEEVHIKHVGRNQYQVFYTVKERGRYILVVRWGDKDIPGSPFEVEV